MRNDFAAAEQAVAVDFPRGIRRHPVRKCDTKESLYHIGNF